MGKGSLFGWLKPKPRLSLGDFRARVAERIIRDWPSARVEVSGEDGLAVWREGDVEPGELSVERAYARYLETPRQLEDAVGWITGSLFYDREMTAEALVVLVRPGNFDPDEGEGGLARPIAGPLVGLPAIDTPDCFQFSKAAHLREDLGLSDAEIWERALANTWALVPPRAPDLEPGEIVQILNELRLAPSLLLHDAMWDDLAVAAKGELMVAPVERNELLVAYRDPEREAALRKMIALRAHDSEWLCDLILVRRDGRWEVLPETAEPFADRTFKH